MVLKKIFPVLLVLLISSCAAPSASGPVRMDDERVRTFASIYRRSKEARTVRMLPEGAVRLTPDAGYDTPYFPVYESGRVVKVWVPAHVAREDKDVLVAGHWVFVVIDPPHWYIEDHGKGTMPKPEIVPTGPWKG